MTYTRLGPMSVESSEGFKVQPVGRQGFVYEEAGRSALLDADLTDREKEICLGNSRWISGEEAPLSGPEERRIAERAIDAMRSIGVACSASDPRAHPSPPPKVWKRSELRPDQIRPVPPS